MRIFVKILVTITVIYACILGAVLALMCQPPERFGSIMAQVPDCGFSHHSFPAPVVYGSRRPAPSGRPGTGFRSACTGQDEDHPACLIPRDAAGSAGVRQL